SEYIIWIDRQTNVVLEDSLSLDSIISEIRRLDRLVMDDADTFRISVLECRIRTNDEDGNLLTNGSVLDHIHGEINYEGNTYFLIDGEWYHIHPDFIADLNDGCANVLGQAWAEDFFKESLISLLYSL
ncbi:MAG TPA: TIGR04141 family sporadically distributed protein, partial [Chitinophagaceae bacterium]|nr:TIGR04141 family sporadically distributed protein [Chitinophagaceae bacterium]